MDYVPEYLINTQMNTIKKEFEARVKEQINKKLEDAIKDMGYKSMEDFDKKVRENAIDNIKFTLGMDQLMKLLDVKVTNADIEREIQQTANMYKLNVEDLKKNASIVNSLRTYMLNDKIMDKLLKVNKGLDKVEAKAKEVKFDAEKEVKKQDAKTEAKVKEVKAEAEKVGAKVEAKAKEVKAEAEKEVKKVEANK